MVFVFKLAAVKTIDLVIIRFKINKVIINKIQRHKITFLHGIIFIAVNKFRKAAVFILVQVHDRFQVLTVGISFEDGVFSGKDQRIILLNKIGEIINVTQIKLVHDLAVLRIN